MKKSTKKAILKCAKILSLAYLPISILLVGVNTSVKLDKKLMKQNEILLENGYSQANQVYQQEIIDKVTEDYLNNKISYESYTQLINNIPKLDKSQYLKETNIEALDEYNACIANTTVTQLLIEGFLIASPSLVGFPLLSKIENNEQEKDELID